MKLFGRIVSLKFPFSRKMDLETAKKERFVSNVIRTRAFSKLSLQNKVLSLGKLITVFRADCGFTPRCLQRTLETLNAELNREARETWNTLYMES